ncbi:MAG TPA: hypothetical protein VFN13_03635 [Rudaea sp.]|nr:hypothetical protein [Rudaea sp.]
MLKLLTVLALLAFAPVGFVLAGALLLPLLALLPALFALGAVLFGLMLGLSLLFITLRVFGLVLLGIGGVMLGVFGFFGLFAAGIVVLAFGVALTHLLLPLLFIGGLIWLIRRASRPAPALVTHSPG